MPTVGWIQETAEDRYWESRGLSLPLNLEPPIHSCPYCKSTFKSSTEYARHISINHPIERPILLLRGSISPSEHTVRAEIASTDISLINTTEIHLSINGSQFETCKLSQLKQAICQSANSYFRITLENQQGIARTPVRSEYTLRVIIASPQQLEEVDRAFISHLARDDVRMSDVRRFADACANLKDAKDYTTALACYVTGILIKDRDSSTSLPFAEYKDKLQQAFSTIKDYDRLVARIVCALVRLNLNDFQGQFLPSGDPFLDVANQLFTTVAINPIFQTPTDNINFDNKLVRPICPIDNESHGIIKDCVRLLSTAPDESFIQHLMEKATYRKMSEYDVVKAQVLAVIATRIVAASTKPAILEELAYDPIFGTWASNILLNQAKTP